MARKSTSGVPEPTLKRLPVYLRYMKKAREQGLLTISAPAMGRELQSDPTQVVKDMALAGASGKPRVGYAINECIHQLESFLGFNKENEAVLVGAGNLGSALLSYPDFLNYGLKIVAAFDNNPEKLGRTAAGINVVHMDKFPTLVEKLQIRIAILTTPQSIAQEVSAVLVKCGIRAIWNLTPARLSVPANVAVQNTSMYSNVAILLNKLRQIENSGSHPDQPIQIH